MTEENYKGWNVCEFAMDGTCKKCQDRDTFYNTCAVGSFCDAYLTESRFREDLSAEQELLYLGGTQ